MRIGVSLVIYNEPYERLTKFINELRNILVDVTLIISIIDNYGHNYKLENVDRYIVSDENLGYGKGHNDNIYFLHKNSCNKILVSNTDVTPNQANLSKLFDSEDGVVIAPLVVNRDGSDQMVVRAFPTIKTKIVSFIKKYPSVLEIHQIKRPLVVPSISGCFFVIDYEKYLALGFFEVFDPRFFMYEEDTDLCRRLWQYKGVIIHPDVCIQHDYGKGSSKSITLFRIHLKSIYIYFKKWGLFDRGSKESRKYIENLF
jgi:GT2 family glycosyltransferase